MVKKGEEKSGIIKRADAGAAAKACKVSVKSNYSGPRPYIRIFITFTSVFTGNMWYNGNRKGRKSRGKRYNRGKWKESTGRKWFG